MPREKESYRDNLERLDAVFPDKELLFATDVSRFLGVDTRTARKMYPFQNNYIAKAVLARKMS